MLYIDPQTYLSYSGKFVAFYQPLLISLTSTPAHSSVLSLCPRSSEPIGGSRRGVLCWALQGPPRVRVKELGWAGSQSLPGAVGCGNVQGGPREATSACGSRAGIGTKQVAGNKAVWRVRGEAQNLPLKVWETGMVFSRRRT